MTKLVFRSQLELAQWSAEHGRGKALHVQVLHDENCTPDVCSCNPIYEVEPLTVESYLEGAKAQRKWVSSSSKRRN
jgi:hypothetical protein